MTDDELTKGIIEYDLLLRTVLRENQVYCRDDDYDDLLQELRIKLLLMLKEESTLADFREKSPLGWLCWKLSKDCYELLAEGERKVVKEPDLAGQKPIVSMDGFSLKEGEYAVDTLQKLWLILSDREQVRLVKLLGPINEEKLSSRQRDHFLCTLQRINQDECL